MKTTEQKDSPPNGLGQVWRWMPWWVAALAALVTGWTLRRGVYLYHDSWSYWEGSVSLLAGRGYNYLDGPPIVYWPPGFSALLALVQGMLGTTGNSLLVLQISLAAVIGFLWAGYVRAFAAGQESSPGLLRGATIGIWLALFVSMTCHGLLANTAQLVLTGAIFWTLVQALKKWQARSGPAGRSRRVAGCFSPLAQLRHGPDRRDRLRAVLGVLWTVLGPGGLARRFGRPFIDPLACLQIVPEPEEQPCDLASPPP